MMSTGWRGRLKRTEERREGGKEEGREGTHQLVGVSMGTPRPAEPVSISTSTVCSPARKEREKRDVERKRKMT